MSEAPLILGVSGLRGIVGESLTPELAVRYAGAFGAWLREREGDPVRVGLAADGRMGWQTIHAAAMAGLLASGCEVIDLGVLTTPTVGNAVDSFGLDGAMQVTASHNPQEWNGLKCIVCESTTAAQRDAAETDDAAAWSDVDPAHVIGARAPTADEAAEIIELFRSHGPAWESNASVGGLRKRSDAIDGHVEDVIFGVSWMDAWDAFRVVVDSVNGSGTRLIEAFSGATGLAVVQLAGADHGVFPHTPEPTKENLSGEGGLCDAVPGLKADVGFAQDPDADRLAIVDEQGSYIGEEYTLVLCAAALMEARKEEGRLQVGPTGGGKPVFVVNLSTSRMIDDVAAHYGAEVVRTPVGEANVVERMKQLKAQGRDVVMGGEGNGGVIWPEVTYVRDSLSAMALTLALMARTGKNVSELVAMVDAMGPGKKGYCILKRKAPLASKADAVPVVEHLTKVYRAEKDAVVDTQDGVRIDWPARGVWAHVRASNTEPIMRVIVEAPTEALATETAKAVEARIAEV